MASAPAPSRRLIRRILPAPVRAAGRRGYDAVVELVDGLRGRRDPLLPPARLMFVGGDRRDFRALGDKWLETFIHVADLEPHEQVLDVGCGVGRMAVALTGYLAPDASYDGFDIVRQGIEWCQRAITSRYPSFRFQHADLYNGEYNPRGTVQASEYRFPYGDGSFDFVFLTSVFTHMLPPDIRHYLAEVRRVLKPNGRCLVTWFVLDAEARERIAAGATQPGREFRRNMGGYWGVEGRTAEGAVAYAESDVRELYRAAGLSIREPILYGGWSGRARPLSNHSQDIVVARK